MSFSAPYRARAARWIASSIASMTMPLSISFSRATASAIAISSALLALTAAGAVAILLFLYSLDLFGAFSAERRGGLNELVGQDELGGCDCGKGQSVRLAALVDELHCLVFDPLERARIFAPVALKGLSEGDLRLVAGPIGKILGGGRGAGGGRGGPLRADSCHRSNRTDRAYPTGGARFARNRRG